jgi:hypothetical protein
MRPFRINALRRISQLKVRHYCPGPFAQFHETIPQLAPCQRTPADVVSIDRLRHGALAPGESSGLPQQIVRPRGLLECDVHAHQ